MVKPESFLVRPGTAALELAGFAMGLSGWGIMKEGTFVAMITYATADKFGMVKLKANSWEEERATRNRWFYENPLQVDQSICVSDGEVTRAGVWRNAVIADIIDHHEASISRMVMHYRPKGLFRPLSIESPVIFGAEGFTQLDKEERAAFRRGMQSLTMSSEFLAKHLDQIL